MRVILAKKRLKVADVARETGLSKSTLTALYYERSKNPTFETLQKVADFLEVTIADLLKVGQIERQASNEEELYKGHR